MTKPKLTELFWRFILVFCLVFVVVWAPSIKIIFYNPAEESISIPDLALISGAVALAASIAAFPFLWFRRIGRLLIYVLIGLSVAAITNTFLVSSSPNVIDGIMENEQSFLIKIAVSAILVLAFVGCWVASLSGRESPEKIARAATICVLTYAGIFSATALWALPANPSRLLAPRLEGNGLQLSAERNILIISFDQMQGSLARGVLRRNPELAARFDGFKFFTDAASVYPNTSYSLSSIMIGRIPKGPEESVDGVLAGKNIIRSSREKGFAAHFVSAQKKCELCAPKTSGKSETVQVAEQSAQLFSFAVQQAFGAGVRTVALLAEPFVPQKLGPTATKASWKLDVGALEESVRNAAATSEKPVVQFRHYYATHQPILYDKNCRVREEAAFAADQSLAGAEGEVTCALTRFVELIDKLKELGLYDKTMLIASSDHGYEISLNSHQDDPLASVFLFPGSDTLGPMNIKPAGAYNPTLIFKDFGVRGPLQEVHSPASLVDVPATVCEAIGGCDFPLEGQSLTKEISRDRVRLYWRYIGGMETRFADGVDRLLRGMGKWWEARSFKGTIPEALVPSLNEEPRFLPE